MKLEDRYVAVIMTKDELRDVVRTHLGYMLEDLEEDEINEEVVEYALETIFSNLMERAIPDAVFLTDGNRILDWAESERMFLSIVRKVFGVDNLMDLLKEL